MKFPPEVPTAVPRSRPRLRLVEPIPAALSEIHSSELDDLQASIARGVDEAFASLAREFRG